MEEVWNEINLSSFHDHSSKSISSALILQDFFTCRPSNKYPPPPLTRHSSSAGEATSRSVFDLRPNPCLRSPSSFLTPSLGSPFKSGLESSDSLPTFPVQTKKRVPESDEDSGDRKHQRMIKNRESAARSRARKQAYTNELEIEVNHLRKENARLKKQLEKFYMATPAAELPKKPTLYRTLTAPF
ncbi:hypothetical protein UlMin_034037 [Ulmus minor]